MKITNLFTEFVRSEKSAGVMLIFCTAISLLLTNSSFGMHYLHFWHLELFSKPVEFWINDGLMTFFFLLVGLEIERELYIGELSGIKKSMLPVLAAIGGMLVPAAIHFAFNHGTAAQKGFGIPMATDIAFSLAVLSLLGNRVPVSVKIFLTALAIIDDLGAILVIALFYSDNLALVFLTLASVIFIILLILNRRNYFNGWLFFLLGCFLWFCIQRSGIHPAITGVLLAFAMPFRKENDQSPSSTLQQFLHKPVAFFILPLFALANTAIALPSSVTTGLASADSLGIIFGLLFGKPIGIFLFAVAGTATGICTMPDAMKKKHLIGTGILAGIGFTMSIFITLLAFNDVNMVDRSKIAVLTASFLSGIIGYAWLYITLPNKITEPE